MFALERPRPTSIPNLRHRLSLATPPARRRLVHFALLPTILRSEESADPREDACLSSKPPRHAINGRPHHLHDLSRLGHLVTKPELHSQHAQDLGQACPSGSGRTIPQRARLKYTPKTPREMSSYIKKQSSSAAVEAARAPDPASILVSHCHHMELLCCVCKQHLNHIHLSAIFHGAAKLCQSARFSATSQQSPVQAELDHFLSSMLLRLKRCLPHIQPRQASSILWSFAKMQINPDDLVHNMTDCLGQQFIRKMDAADGQGFATLLLACVHLQVDPRQGDVCQRIVQHLNLTDLLHFDAQAVANLAWALQELRYAPPASLASSMIGRLLNLCCEDSGDVRAHHISNLLFALAELRLPVSQHNADALVSALVSRLRLDAQDLTNTAWSLAVLDRLNPETYQGLQNLLSKCPETSLDAQNVRQMHQALESLQPASDDPIQQIEAWNALQQELCMLSASVVDAYGEPNFHSREELHAVLTELGLHFHITVDYNWYWVDALITAPDCASSDIIILLESRDYIKNEECRLSGRAVFRQQLLAQYGSVVLVPHNLIQGDVAMLAEFLEPRLQAAAEGNLDAYQV